jgi:hypothetical protein
MLLNNIRYSLMDYKFKGACGGGCRMPQPASQAGCGRRLSHREPPTPLLLR